jgi:teichuronic acid biosynthesis glycosyltransferase TuaC
MRVLFVTNMWPDEERPWYGTFVKSQATSLERLGVEIEVIAIRGYQKRSAYLKAASSVRAAARGVDLVHAHYGHAAAVARLQTRAPLVISYCGDDLLGTPGANGSMTSRSRAEAAVFRRLAHAAKRTITKSEEMERALPRRCRARNSVIPNGVDLERFAPAPQRQARQELGWPLEGPIALFAGDPSIPRKNFPLAEQVWRVAQETSADLRLEVASGYPPAQVPTLMSAADVLLLTSITEGSPNVVKEAMAAELPVVATAVGDVEERLRNVEGCYAGPPAPESLAEALVGALRHGRSAAAREAVAPLSLEAVAHRVLDVYRAAVAKTVSPGYVQDAGRHTGGAAHRSGVDNSG